MVFLDILPLFDIDFKIPFYCVNKLNGMSAKRCLFDRNLLKIWDIFWKKWLSHPEDYQRPDQSLLNFDFERLVVTGSIPIYKDSDSF